MRGRNPIPRDLVRIRRLSVQSLTQIFAQSAQIPRLHQSEPCYYAAFRVLSDHGRSVFVEAPASAPEELTMARKSADPQNGKSTPPRRSDRFLAGLEEASVVTFLSHVQERLPAAQRSWVAR